MNVTPVSPLREFASYIAGIVALIAAAYYLSIFIAELLIPYIGPESEQWLWDNVFEQEFITKDTPSAAMEAKRHYVQTLLDRIAKDHLPPHHYTIILRQENEVNAFALPAGHIIVYTGLLDHIRSENGLTFVLAHELGHYAHRDHLRSMGRSLVAAMLLMPLSLEGGYADTLFSSIRTSFDMHFSREQESQADDFALAALTRVYGHGGGATELFEELAAHEGVLHQIAYASTHPLSSDRIQLLEEHMQKQGIIRKDVAHLRLPLTDVDR